MKRDSLQILVFALLFAVAYTVLVKITGLHADFSETNFHANLGRIHLYLNGPHRPIEILGSSMSGRLLPEYFTAAGCTVGNLALDGGKPVTGLKLLLRRPDLPAMVLLEENTLSSEPGANDPEIMSEIEGFSFWLQTRVPILQPQSRPSSILYSILKRWHERQPLPSDTMQVALVPEPPVAITNAIAADAKLQASPLVSSVRKLIQELQQRGVKVAVFHLPHGKTTNTRSDEPDTRELDDLIQQLNLPCIDVGYQMLRQNLPIQYTDGIHLTATSAREASAILSLWLHRDFTLPQH
jgi:hypothetical protein